MKQMLVIAFSSIIYAAALSQPLHVSSGTVKRFNHFPSKYVTTRNVDVWLPEGYSFKKKYAVLYMHDGQMLFDNTITWNHQEWGVDETLGKLMNEKKIRDCIVVGVWNGGSTRFSDYFPQKPFDSLPRLQRDSLYKANSGNASGLFTGAIQSDSYLKFLVKELKPFIDSSFSVFTNSANTFIAGSSMGGLISMYAICEYPDIYGGAACLSTHWPGIFSTLNNPVPEAFLSYLAKHLPSPVNHKLYFDHGTRTLDSMYAAFQQKADNIIRSKGYTPKNFMTRVFKDADHSEASWNKRFDIPSIFLLQ